MSASSGSRPSGSSASTPAEIIRLYSAVGRRELEIERRSENRLTIVEKAIFQDGDATLVKESVHRVDLQNDAVLLYYTISKTNDPARKWNVAIVYGKGSDRETIEYPLLSEPEVFRFQRLVASYTPYKRFERVGCSALSPRMLRRAVEVDIFGELQLWCLPRARHSAPAALQPTRTASSNARGSGSVATTARTLQGATVQTDYRGREVAVTAAEAPPLLVSFEERNGEYKMMRVDVTGLNYQSSSQDSKSLDLIASPGKSFYVDILKTNQLEAWNLCDLRPRAQSKKFTKHECTYLTLYFKERSALELFVKSLRLVQAYALGVSLGRPRLIQPGTNGSTGSRSSLGSLPDIPDVGEFFQQLLNELDGNANFGREAQGANDANAQSTLMTPPAASQPPSRRTRTVLTSQQNTATTPREEDEGEAQSTEMAPPAMTHPPPRRTRTIVESEQHAAATPRTGLGFPYVFEADDGDESIARPAQIPPQSPTRSLRSSVADGETGSFYDGEEQQDGLSSRTLDRHARSVDIRERGWGLFRRR